MPHEEILGEMQISHRRDDGCQKDADPLLSLRQQLLKRLQSQRKITRGYCVSDIKDSALARRRYHFPNVPRLDRMPGPEGRFEFVEFVIELAGIQPHPRGKDLDSLTGNF